MLNQGVTSNPSVYLSMCNLCFLNVDDFFLSEVATATALSRIWRFCHPMLHTTWHSISRKIMVSFCYMYHRSTTSATAGTTVTTNDVKLLLLT